MKSSYLTKVDEAVNTHACAAIFWLYKEASVGDNRLELGEEEISYSDGAEYVIEAVEVNFRNHRGKTVADLVYHQYEEDNEDERETYDVSGLKTGILLELLEAVENVVGIHYPDPFILPPPEEETSIGKKVFKYLSDEYFNELVHRIENTDGDVIINVTDKKEWLRAFKKSIPYIKSIRLEEVKGKKSKYKLFANI